MLFGLDMIASSPPAGVDINDHRKVSAKRLAWAFSVIASFGLVIRSGPALATILPGGMSLPLLSLRRA
jgi:hypothetical protein